jgi:hypothetical protein
MKMEKKIGLARVTGIALFVIMVLGPISFSCLQAEEEEPVQGIKIILSIYSGRRNPQWWVPQGPEFEKLVQILKGLKSGDAKLFSYNLWNTLGYSSFWIIPKNMQGLPFAVHIWHDEAMVTMKKGEATVQAIGAMPLYDMLAEHALRTKMAPEKCFQRYLELRSEQKNK